MPEQTGFTNSMPSAQADPFFVLRDCRELFQKRLADIAWQTGVSSPAVIEAFAKEIGITHDELVNASRQDGFEQTAGLTASRISLVGNDDLELEIRIGEIANRLRDNERIEHWRAQSRYMTLLNRPQMNVDNSPVGLEPIRRGLWVLSKEGGENLEKTLARLDRMEEQLQLCLPEVYRELNEVLKRNGIAPTAPKIIQRESGQMPAGSAGAASPEGFGGSNTRMAGLQGNNALAALQQALQNQAAANNPLPQEVVLAPPAQSGANFALDASAVVMLNQLMERLRVLELQQMTGLSNLPVGSSSDEMPLHALKAKDLDLPLGTPTAIALDTLSLIFEAIFARPELPEAIKTGIGRLQIPLLRLSMLDATFFSDTEHPARRLINRIAQTAVGLSPDSGRDHPRCAKLAKLADAARSALESGNTNLTAQLDELDTLIKERDERVQNGANTYVQLVRKHEALEVARTAAQSWLAQTLRPISEPEIRDFLAKYWVRLMQDAYFDSGKEGARAKEYEITVRDLLWSIQPKPTPEERKQLPALIPNLLKRINTGFDLLKVPAEERKPFLDACFRLQTASLRNRPEDAVVPAPAVEQTSAVTTDHASAADDGEVIILQEKGKLVQYLGEPGGTYASIPLDSSLWKDGDWLSFVLPDGESLCGRVCWQGPPFSTVVLFNTDWGYAVALAPALLSEQLRNGKARIATESLLFDEAAKNALSQIAPS